MHCSNRSESLVSYQFPLPDLHLHTTIDHIPITMIHYLSIYLSILFYSVLFCSVLFYSMLCYAMLCYAMLFYSILFYSILFYLYLQSQQPMSRVCPSASRGMALRRVNCGLWRWFCLKCGADICDRCHRHKA